jgi:protein subunit release factor B
MGGSSSKNTCQNENSQIAQLKSQLQLSNDRLLQYQLNKSRENYDPENDNNILYARVGGKRRKKRSSRNPKKKGTRKMK